MCRRILNLQKCNICENDTCSVCMFDNVHYTNMFKNFCDSKCLVVPLIRPGNKYYCLCGNCLCDFQSFVCNNA